MWDQSVSWDLDTTPDASMILFNNATDTPYPCSVVSQVDGQTIQLQPTSPDAACNYFVLCNQTYRFVTANGLNIGQGYQPIT